MYLAVDFQGGIENAWSNVATFVPKLVAALVILLVGWFVAKAVASILDKVLERVGFDRVVERGGVRQVLAEASTTPPTSWPSWCSGRSCCSCSSWPSGCSAPTPSPICSVA